MARCVGRVAGHFLSISCYGLRVRLLTLNALAVFADSSSVWHFIYQLEPVTSPVECNTADPQPAQRVLSAACYQMVNIVDGSYRIHGYKLRR